jgi:hypothetical protein
MFGYVSFLKKHVTLNLTINSTFLKSVTEQHCYLLIFLINERTSRVCWWSINDRGNPQVLRDNSFEYGYIYSAKYVKMKLI